MAYNKSLKFPKITKHMSIFGTEVILPTDENADGLLHKFTRKRQAEVRHCRWLRNWLLYGILRLSCTVNARNNVENHKLLKIAFKTKVLTNTITNIRYNCRTGHRIPLLSMSSQKCNRVLITRYLWDNSLKFFHLMRYLRPNSVQSSWNYTEVLIKPSKFS